LGSENNELTMNNIWLGAKHFKRSDMNNSCHATTHKSDRFPQFLKFMRMFFLCGFIAGLACLAVPNASAKLVVVKAAFGDFSNPAAMIDVTANIAAMIKNDELNVEVNADNLPDPAQGVKKQLKVDYTVDGVAGSKFAIEGTALKILANEKPTSSRLVIHKAVYGDFPDGSYNDVTAIITALVENDALEVMADKNYFGDPAFRKKKHLRVDYAFDGVEGSKTVIEGFKLRISAKDKFKAGPHRLIIRKAVYGNLAAGKINDVAALIGEMIDYDALDVEVNDDNFDDPAPEMSKKLYVDYTFDGQERSKTVIRGDRLKISANDKPGSSILIIRRAEYGDLPNGQASNVTAIISAMVENDALDVMVSNDNFDDPAPEKRKKLRVDYTFNGEERSKTVIERERLKILPSDKSAAVSKFHSSKLFIRQAEYGDLPDGNFNDVTAIVAAMVENDALNVDANNDNFDDPAPERRKKLRVDYTFNGEERSKTVVERNQLKISPSDKSAGIPKSSSSKLIIRKAEYGDLPDGNFNDVTAMVAAMVENDALNVQVNNDNFDDPAFKIRKLLRVDFTFDGEEGSKTAADRVTLRISARDTIEGQRLNPPKLVIRRAVYGAMAAGKTNDVTAFIAAMVEDDALDVEVNDENFRDPAPKVKKKLQVDYTFNGEERSKAVFDLNRLRISANDKPFSTNLVIRAAIYGDISAGKTNDVTAIVAAMVDNDELDLKVGNDNFDDPAPNKYKKLRVDYTLNGGERSKTVIEGDRLKISPNDKTAGVPKSNSSRLIIHKAEYGDLPDGSFNDVTAIIAAMVESDALNIQVNNDNFDDPAFRKKKHLRVDYAFDGETKSRIIEENQTLTINAHTEKPGNGIGAIVLAILVVVVGGGLMIRKWKK